MATDIDPFCIHKGAISPGGSAAIGLRVDWEVRALCIGSGGNLRDAKACALRNVRLLLTRLERLDPDAAMLKTPNA